MKTTSEIIDALGGTAEVARLCNVKPPSVSEWKANDEIPEARVLFLALLRPDLFPDVPKPEFRTAADTEAKAA